MILVKTCCGCISLRTGTIVIGVLSLIGTILNTIMMGLHASKLEIPRSGDSTVVLLILVKMLIVSILIHGILGGIFAVFLIVGAVKRIASYVFPWVAITFASVVAAFCLALGFSIVAAIEFPVSQFFFVLFISSFCTAMQIYFWQVVYSHYKELVAEKFGHVTRPNDGKILASPPYHNV